MPSPMENQLLSKETILEKSSAVFRKKGYASTSISMLAEACNMSKSHFYYYFLSKEMLMEEILKHELTYFMDHVFLLAYEEAFSPKKRLKKIFKQLQKIYCDGNTGSLMTMTIFHTTEEESERFSPIIRQFYEEWQKALFTIFSLKFSDKKSRKLTVSTVLQIEGALIFLVLNKNSSALEEVFHNMLAEISKT